MCWLCGSIRPYDIPREIVEDTSFHLIHGLRFEYRGVLYMPRENAHIREDDPELLDLVDADCVNQIDDGVRWTELSKYPPLWSSFFERKLKQ